MAESIAKLVVSTVGTSLLTNQIDRDIDPDSWTALLQETANCTLDEVQNYHENVLDVIEKLKQRAEKKLGSRDVKEIRKSSAELNGILGLYQDQLGEGKLDVHWLIATDTAQGQVTAEIVRVFLHSQNINVQIYTPKGLSTISTESFSNGIDEFLNWIDETVSTYKESRYHICFNLIGGFKALQGYANTIGMFYADEILYIFEGSSEVITIPRLPIQIDESVIAPTQFALMAAGAWIDVKQLQNVHEALIFVVADKATLTNWGRLTWNRCKENLLCRDLMLLPKIKYSPTFEKDYKNIKEKSEKLKLQETLAKVSYLLSKSSGSTASLKNDGGLLYETYVNKDGIDHFRINQGIRVSCTSSNGILTLRRYGQEPIVNNNP